MADYARPARLEDALALLSAATQPWRPLAGGTDVYPALVDRPPPEALLDLTALEELRGIEPSAEGWRIGALTTWSELLAADLPAAFDGLKAAAREVGGVQIQNAGTVAGNLCNASPAADSVPPFLTLEAEVELASTAGRRRLALADFITGVRRTARRPDELLTAVVVPRLPETAGSRFLKLGARRYLVISIVMVAALLVPDAAGRVARAALSVGACSPVARRLPGLEARLLGRPLGPDLGAAVEPDDLRVLSPIDDVRAEAGYRLVAAEVLLRRALADLGGQLQDRAAA